MCWGHSRALFLAGCGKTIFRRKIVAPKLEHHCSSMHSHRLNRVFPQPARLRAEHDFDASKSRSEASIVRVTSDPITFAGSVLAEYRHVCAFFSSTQEEYATLLPFVFDGIQRGERAYHVLRSEYRETHIERLRSAGIDVTGVQQRRQLEVATVEETYLRGGRFNPNAMLDLIQDTLKNGTALGFPLTRLIAHVAEKILEDWSNADEWIKYEARLNEVLPAYNDPVICTYDTNLITGTIAVDVLRTHPVAIVGGLLYENPFFVQPREFLSQFQQRSAAS
jgi:hypothetical protein